eukprot:4584239-Amphidinium_carterae.1
MRKRRKSNSQRSGHCSRTIWCRTLTCASGLRLTSVSPAPYGDVRHEAIRRRDLPQDRSACTAGLRNLASGLQGAPYSTHLIVNLSAVTPARLDRYADHVHRLAKLYGPTYWGAVYAADVKMRQEHFERLQRRGAALGAAAGVRHQRTYQSGTQHVLGSG